MELLSELFGRGFQNSFRYHCPYHWHTFPVQGQCNVGTVLASFPAPYRVGLVPSPIPCWPHSQPHTVLASFPTPYCVGLIPILCWPHSHTVLASFPAPCRNSGKRTYPLSAESACCEVLIYLVGRAHIVCSVLP